MKQIGIFRNENKPVPLLPQYPPTGKYLTAYGLADYLNYIETDVYVLDKDVEVEIKFNALRPYNDSCSIFAASWYVEGHMLQQNLYDDYYNLTFNSTQELGGVTISNLQYGQTYTLKQGLHYLYLNGVQATDYFDLNVLPYPYGEDSSTLKIAGVTVGHSDNNKFRGDIYYIKIWKNGVLVRDFVPTKNNLNEVGLLNKLNGQFYKAIDQENWHID